MTFEMKYEIGMKFENLAENDVYYAKVLLNDTE